MSPSLYDVTIPVFIRALGNLSEILKKAEAFAEAQHMPASELIDARLIADMFPMVFQVQRVTDAAKFVPTRVGGAPSLDIVDSETSFEELHARINRTVEFLKSIDPEIMRDRDDAEVVLKNQSGETKLTARAYVLNSALPNFYFHLSMAYAILRHKGVPVGKTDFLGRIA